MNRLARLFDAPMAMHTAHRVGRAVPCAPCRRGARRRRVAARRGLRALPPPLSGAGLAGLPGIGSRTAPALHRLRRAVIGACLGALGVAAVANSRGADEPSSLGGCALRYGSLMTEHWLTVDLTQQIERGLSYAGGSGAAKPSADLAKLQAAVAAEGQELDRARSRYKVCFATNTTDGLRQLSRALDGIAAAEADDSAAAAALLQAVGSQSVGHEFRALPVTDADLAPAWDAHRLIGRHYRPTRIIFGSTGKAGDDRTLPLRFDFGSGVFGFYVPMATSNKLAIADSVRTQTDPQFTWMRTNHSGYHYWAGVYNNQNTYLAPWFLQQHTNEDDIWMKLADGKVLRDKDWGQVNIWNADIRSYIQDYCETQGRTFRHDPFLVCYDYTGEPHPYAAQPPGQPQYSGYNESAVQAFRAYLRRKFGSIARLNQAWPAKYAGFEAIEPPPDPYLAPPAPATPLRYEFERFRCDSHARYWRLVYDAYRKGDPAKPIEANAGMFMSGWPVEGLDSYQLQRAGVADWVDMHMNNFWPNLPEQIYLYSLCRLTRKVPVEFEYVWSFPRTGPFDDASEADFSATCQASVWRNLAWGKQVLVFFDFYYDWPAYHNAFLDRDLGYSILRPSACVVPVTKRRALRFNDILLRTEVATPPIIVLEPTASILNSPQLHPNKSFSYHSHVAGKDVHELLFPANYPFLYVPEQAVLDGYSLKQHRVIILPEAPYLPTGMTDRLLSWVKAGGTLISFGVPGIWTPYGANDLRLVSAAFGPTEVKDERPGEWKWSWSIAGSGPKPVRELNNAAGQLAAALVTLGRGRVLVATGAFETPELRRLFYEVLDLGIGRRPAACQRDAFELVLRQDPHGHRFLFALNPDLRATREDQVTVAGQCSHCTDLGVGSGVPVPARAASGQTVFALRLHPGEGTVISLAR